MGYIHCSLATKMRPAIVATLISLTAGSPYYYLPAATSYGYTTYPYYNYAPVVQYAAPAYASYPRGFSVQPRLNIGGGDIIAQTRTLSNGVQATLRQLAADPASAVIVNRIINDKDNICLSSLEEGIAGIETATQLVEAAGGDIKALISKVQAFQTLSNPPTVVREVGNILRILGPLVNNIAPKNPIICQATPDQSFGSLRSLAVIVDELASTNQLALTPAGRGQLKESANTISAVVTFLSQICTADKQYNIESIKAVGDLMVNLADLFGSLGGVQTGENIRKGQAFVQKVVNELNKIGDLGVGELNCNRPGDFTLAADTMDEVATLIEEVGLDNLQQQLGVDFSFILNP